MSKSYPTRKFNNGSDADENNPMEETTAPDQKIVNTQTPTQVPTNANGDSSERNKATKKLTDDETLALSAAQKKTDTLDDAVKNAAKTRQLDNSTRQLGDNAIVLPQTPPRRLRFLVREGDAVIEIGASLSMVIGRKNSSRPVDVDLMPYDAPRYGVSRQHVKIEPRGRGFVAKDLRTVNGTTLNKKTMTPGHYYDIHDGDELKLGAMHIIIRFVWDE